MKNKHIHTRNFITPKLKVRFDVRFLKNTKPFREEDTIGIPISITGSGVLNYKIHKLKSFDNSWKLLLK